MATTSDNETTEARPAASTIWLVGGDAAITARLTAAVRARDRRYEIATIAEPTQLMAAARPALPLLCCLLCGEAADDTARAVALLRKLAGPAPILLIDRGGADFDLTAARRAGAWDHCPADDDALLAARLAQALEVGRQRQELIVAGQRLNQAQRRLDVVLGEDKDARARSALSEGAMRPPLDGRMALHDVLASVANRAQEHRLGLIFVAVDEIEMLQQQFGLARSDLLLQEIGLFLLQSLRGGDRCFRFGAGEYVLIVERPAMAEIAAAAGRIHAAFAEEPFGDDLSGVRLSASMTHSTLSGDVEGNDRCLGQLMDRAYALRRDGGDACLDCAETAAEREPAPAVDDWSARLREALAQDRFSLAYQGITSLAGDSQPYFDVLLRYIDDRGLLVRPGEFLAAAEQTGLMPDIDRWVTARAIGVVAQQRAANAEIALFVKLSVATIVAGGEFLRWLGEAVAANDVPRHGLIFSFREDDVRTQARAAKTLAAELDAQGFRVALTHFGSTPRAVQVLDDLPAAFVKLAPDFAKEVAGGEDERLLRAIAATRERRIPLIAEQIEDANSMAHLWQAGVNYVQGHFIQEPDTEALAHSENRML